MILSYVQMPVYAVNTKTDGDFQSLESGFDDKKENSTNATDVPTVSINRIEGGGPQNEDLSLTSSTDVFDNAMIINTNVPYTDNLTTSSDVNYYKFTTNSDGYISFSFSHEYVDSTYEYWIVTLYDNQKKSIITWEYTGNTEAEIISCNMGFPAGEYYIRVIPYSSYFFSDQNYSLKVNYTSTSSWETEYNNDFTTADTISPEFSRSGSIMHANDVDYYKFTTDVDGFVSLTFSHGYIDSTSKYWEVVLYDTGKEVMNSWEFESNTEAEITTGNIGLSAGTYYACVRPTISTLYKNKDYTLKINHTASLSWEIEYNDTFQSAEELKVGSLYYGSIMHNKDVDYYQVTTDEAGYIWVSFQSEYVNSTSALYVVSIYDKDKQEITFSNFRSDTTGSKDTLPIGVGAGIYYVKIEPYYSWSSVDYSFSVNYTASDDWETEFNEIFSDADELELDNAVTGNLRNSSDVDFYKLNIQQNGIYDLLFTHDYFTYYDGSAFWKIAIFNSNMEVLAEYGSSCTESVIKETGISLNSGIYYLKVFVGYNHSSINYTLTISSSNNTPTNPPTETPGNTNPPSTEPDASFTKTKVKVNTVLNNSNDVMFSWHPLSGAEGYYIYRRIGSGKWQQIDRVDGGDTKYYHDFNVTSGKTYSYKVKAYAGSKASQLSDASAKIKFLQATNISVVNEAKGVKVSWNKVKGAAGYDIYRQEVGATSWSKIARVKGVNKVKYTDKKAVSGVSYRYAVGAYSGKYVGEVVVYDNATVCYLKRPNINKIENVKEGLYLYWNEIQGADGYYIYRKTDKSSWTGLGYTSEAYYVDSTAQDGTKYTYSIRAFVYDDEIYEDGKYSKDSAIKSLTRLSEPANVTVNTHSKGLEVSWNSVYGAKSYQIFRRTAGGNWKRIASVGKKAQNRYVDKKAKNGAEYYYTVVAVLGKAKSSKDEVGVSQYTIDS